jgi:hypothetical protein
MRLLARLLEIATLASAALLSACGGGGGSGGGGIPVTDAGFLKVALTDAAACGYNQINVTVQKVRAHTSATAADSDPGWWEVVLSPAPKVDLLTLTNGTVLELGQVQLPVGTYQQLSLVLAANDATTPLANSVVPVGPTPTETPLATPAGLQSGLKIPVSIAVTKDQISDYVIDFDACNSVLRLGASGSYNLSPRIAAIQRLSATGQRVTGFVATTLAPSSTRISLQQAGTVVRTTNPDATGRFVLYPVPTGTYDLVISALAVVPAVVTNVPVTATASTDVNTVGTPIDPPPSPIRTISGTVITNTTPIDARVAIVKKYTGGPNVTMFGAPADATTGFLAYTVSTAAPVRAPYVAGITPLVFSPDNTAPTGRYTVVVTAKGTVQSTDVDATSTDPVVSFTF